jgi:hypothetical protein
MKTLIAPGIMALFLLGTDAAAVPMRSTPCGPPRLTILSPRPGDTVRAPVEVRFRVRCFRLGAAPHGHIHAWARRPGESRRYELRPKRQAGVVQIPDATLSGEHTLTFQLARANHRPLRNTEARVVVRGVVFESP